MAERAACDSFRRPRLSSSLLKRLWGERLVTMRPSVIVGLRLGPAMVLRRHELPNPFAVGRGETCEPDAGWAASR